MLKSLFSGVSGLQSHQVAMDIESNNIANVNTVGYKYSRANFSDLLAQTKSIATAPQGELGGKNAVQVGLGSAVSSMTRIFSQGSVQNTDKNTDIAIQGDGFFIISPDGGNTYKYTRAGDFKFDAGGNFVDNNGFIAQGWLRDPVTGKVDSTAPITNINIPPGLTTPANPTAEVVLKANLNSGPIVESYSKTDGGAVAAGASELSLTFTLDNGTTKTVTTSGALATNTAAQNAARYVSAINAQTATTGITASYDAVNNKIDLINTNGDPSASHNIRVTANNANSGITTGTVTTAYRYQYDPTGTSNLANTDKRFTTIADLRYAMEIQANALDANGDTVVSGAGIEISINEQGKFQVINPGGFADSYDINLQITGMTGNSIVGGGITENALFTRNMTALNAVLPVGSGGKAFSQSFNAATHSSSIDIFDSLGSKHTLRMEFRKVAVDSNTGSTWNMLVTVPSPATIDTQYPYDQKAGSIRFNNDGSLATYNPPNISFSGNNGSAPDQQVNLSFGTANAFDGMTSFNAKSATSGISQDGYTGGDLVGIRIDQSGTLVGSFSNGRSFGLAQIGMAKFTNNEGLATEGGNVYIQTANSGDPIIGTAATAGRGFIQSSALEASNVDLSSALTQLIIIQRGYQANGKTITTSDQLLQTLIGLK
ncbi:MAG: flagellar hook-basal body complex protein, partial [Halothiobacillus sp.]|nr:flagellar hook-basal body complex protein [Halothiobacillus sp.]